MKLTFLGTAAAVPSRARNVSGLALQFDQRREWWLFDCGEGTQHRLLRTNLALSQVRRVFLSHLHGDHSYGLPGLLATRGFKGGSEPVDIYGPTGTKEFVEVVRRVTGTHYPYPYVVHEITAPGIIFEDDEYLVHAAIVPHVGVTLAFVVEEKPRAGSFRVDEAKALGIPPGPIYSRLKAGEKVTLPDGREIDGASLVNPPRPGRKLAVVCDTSDASALVDAARGAQVLVHEATFLESSVDLAEAYGHSSAAGAAKFAKTAGVARLILNHFSLRYMQGDPALPKLSDLVKEAEANFEAGKVIASEDYLGVEVTTDGAKVLGNMRV